MKIIGENKEYVDIILGYEESISYIYSIAFSNNNDTLKLNSFLKEGILSIKQEFFKGNENLIKGLSLYFEFVNSNYPDRVLLYTRELKIKNIINKIKKHE